jgi:hypothetical protein
MMQQSSTSPSFTSWARTIIIDRREILSVLLQTCCLLVTLAQVKHEWLTENNRRRFKGPLNVSATPNRAVRVGKTQSALMDAYNDVSEHSDRKRELAYHIDSKSHAYQKVLNGESLDAVHIKYMYGETYLLQSLCPCNTAVLSHNDKRHHGIQPKKCLTILR